MSSAAHSRRWKLGIIAAFAAFLGVGAVAAALKLPPILPALSGVEAPANHRPWSELSWFRTDKPNESKQHVIEERFNARVGWRNFLVRLDNQVTWSAFLETTEPKKDDTGGDIGTHVIYGVHEWLFEKHYIFDSVKPPDNTDAQIQEQVARIKRVQDKLTKRGIAFLLVVAPSKVEIYPEKIPPHLWRGKSKDAVETTFERTRPVFDATGVNWIDGPALFTRWKAEGKRNLFARSGTHWSYKSAVDVLALMRERLNATMRRPLPPLLVSSEHVGKPLGSDRDLLDLCNLLLPQPYEHATPLPIIQAQLAVPEAELPRILWVHDSFGWNFIDQMYLGKVMAPSESLYYFKTQKRIPGGVDLLTDVQANHAKLDFPNYLASKDAVVVVWTEISQSFWGWGFFEAVDAALD